MSGRKCCFGNPKFLCAEEPGIFFLNYLYLRLCHSEAKGLVCPCLAQWQLWSEDDTKTESVQKETHFSNLGQRWSCFSSLKQFVHFSKLRVIGSKPCSLQASKQNHRINPQRHLMVLLSSTNLLPSGLISSVFIKLYGHSVPSLHTMTDLVQILHYWETEEAVDGVGDHEPNF